MDNDGTVVNGRELTSQPQQYSPPDVPGITQTKDQTHKSDEGTPLLPNVVHQNSHNGGTVVGGVPQAQRTFNMIIVRENDQCFNVYWMLFIIGFLCPISWLFGTMALNSQKRNERMAGVANFIATKLFLILLIVSLSVI